MADDAAGAVRRTPRPDEALDTFRCHEPFRRDAEVRVSFTGRYYAGAFMGSHIVDADDHHRCTVPPDAVTLLPDGDVVERAAHPLAANALRRYEAEQGFADHLTADDFMADAREDVRALAADGLLNDPERGRPVVLLRAEDCSCPTGGDCPHGPELVDALDLARWLHAEAARRLDASERRRTAQAAELRTSERVRAAHVAEIRRLAAERDEAVALCAKLQTTILSRLAELAEAAGKARSTEWLRTCATLPMEEWPPAPAHKGPMVPAADLDALSLLLRAMARKLVGYRRWTLGDDVPAVHQLRRERDALQARLDATFADLKEADELSADWPPSLEDWSAYNSKLIHARAALQGDKPAEPPRRRPLLIAPDDPCQDERCSRVDGRCVGSHCGRCNQPSSSQGHYTSFCSNSKGGTKHHFCCPDDCELVAEPTGEVDRG